MKSITVKIITAKTPTRRYPKEILTEAIERAKPLISNQKLFVSNVCPESSQIPIMNIIGVVKNLFLENEDVYATIQFLNTAAHTEFAKTVANIPNLQLTDSFYAIGMGTVKRNKKTNFETIGSDYEICGVYLK